MASNNYNVLFDAKLNIKNAQAEINQFIAKNNKLAKIDIKISDNITQQFKTATKSVDEFVGKISTIDKTTNTINTSFEKFTSQTNKWVDSQGKLNTVLASTSESGKRMTTWIKEYTDETGNLVKETSQYNNLSGRWQKVNQENVVTTKEAADAQAKLAKELNETSQASNQTASSIDNAAKATQSLGERLVTAAGKVALFKVSTTIVMAFYNAIGDAKDRVVEYDKALTELKKVWDDSYGSLDRLSKKLSEIGKETANTLTNMTDIATGIVKAGYNNERDIAIMAEYVAKLQNTADEELTAAEATSILVSQLKAYHMEASEASRVTDILNAVSAKQAVSSGDLSKALTVGSSSMATYGNTIEQTTALITAGTTVMQNRSQQVSRG